MALVSPGLEISVTDESQYVPGAVGTVPLIIMATAQDKTNPQAQQPQTQQPLEQASYWPTLAKENLLPQWVTPALSKAPQVHHCMATREMNMA